jgi:hypothetical protein
MVLRQVLLGSCIVSAAGCSFNKEQEHFQKFPTTPRAATTPAAAPTVPTGATASLDREVLQLQNEIQYTRDVINQSIMDQLDAGGQLMGGKNFVHSADFNASGGQNPGETNGERMERISKDLEVQRKELERQKRARVALEQQQQSAKLQSIGCFTADTAVLMADGTLRPFASVKPGDSVQTYDIGYERPVPRTVVEVYQVQGNHLYLINQDLRTTGGERLLTQNGWQTVRNLKVGDSVHVGGRAVKVESITLTPEAATLYNMQVADTHNFYVVMGGQTPYLVHNTSGGGGGGSSGGGGGK